MKKHIKNLLSCLSLVVGLSLLASPASSVKAAPNGMSLKELDSKYGLKTISMKDVPSNVKPIEFKSIADADAYLSKHKKEINEQNKIAKDKIEKLKSEKLKSDTSGSVNNYTSMLTSDLNSSQTKTVLTQNGVTYFKMKVVYQYSGRYFSSCSAITTSVTGFTMGTTWTQSSSYSNIIDGGRTLAASAGGTEAHYILVNGTVQTTSDDLDLYGEFTL